MKTYSSQQGRSFANVVLVIACLVIVLVSLGKLIPIYKDHYSTIEMIESAEVPKAVSSINVERYQAKFRRDLAKQQDVNGVYDFDVKALSFKKRSNYLEATLSYDREVKLSRNWKLVIHFEDVMELYPE